MKLNFSNRVNFALVITILFFLVLSCDAWISLRGKIQDENGNNINKAQIIVEQGESKVAEEVSKENGSFDIREHLCPTPGCSSYIKLTVNKEGYEIYEKVLSNEEMNGREIKIILKKN